MSIATESAAQSAVCPVCRGQLDERRGWMIRRSGVWLRFRTRDCVATFEGDPDVYNRPDRDLSRDLSRGESPSSE